LNKQIYFHNLNKSNKNYKSNIVERNIIRFE